MVIQSILSRPWIALVFVLVLAFLWLVAWKRDRRDRIKKHRAEAERGDRLRAARNGGTLGGNENRAVEDRE
jgi:membrane protein implicated in regulation of membrane protease activity